MSAAMGSCGASTGAESAVTTSRASTPPENHGSDLRGAMANPRVEIAVEHVDQEVPREVEGAQHQHAGLHDRIVARGDALEDQPAQARPREHRLRHDRAPQELHEE